MTRGFSPYRRMILLISLVWLSLSLVACSGFKKPAVHQIDAPPGPEMPALSQPAPAPPTLDPPPTSEKPVENTASIPEAADQESREQIPVPEWPKSVLIAAVGDVMMGTEYLLPDDGGIDLFASSKSYLKQADIAFGNLEGPLTDRGQPAKVPESGVVYCFRTPPHYAAFLQEAGFNMVSIANNHIYDYGEEGKDQTIETLGKYAIQYSGPPGTVAHIMVNGLIVAMVAFHSSAHSYWLNDIPEARRVVAELAAQNDVVIVSFHGGAEGDEATHVPYGNEIYHEEDRGDLRSFAHAVVDAGADLVIGHGPHVPRGMEIYKNRLIAYSLGNFCTGKGIKVSKTNGLAPMLIVRLDSHGFLLEGKIISFKQRFGKHPEIDSSGEAAALMARLSREDFPTTHAQISEGNISVARPVQPVPLQVGQAYPLPVPASSPVMMPTVRQ